MHFIDLNGCYLWIAITSWVQLNTEHDAKIENIENEIEVESFLLGPQKKKTVEHEIRKMTKT